MYEQILGVEEISLHNDGARQTDGRNNGVQQKGGRAR